MTADPTGGSTNRDVMAASLHSSAASLWCPSCRSEIALPSTSEHAIARCECRSYPYVEGVVVGDVAVREPMLASIRAGDIEASRKLLLGRHRSKYDLLFRSRRPATFRQFLRHNELVRLTEGLGLRKPFMWLRPRRLFRQIVDSAQFNLYMRHRFCAPSLLATMALLGLVRLRPGAALDAPCGMGHLSWMLSRLVPAQHLLCLDLVPSFAYSARRFFVPDAAASIAHDLNYPMPLADGSISTIISSDSIHYVDNKTLLVSEFKRVLNDTGVVVVSHMHNKLQHNPAAGSPLTPQDYYRLFDGFHVQLQPEADLLRSYLDNQAVDLSTPVPLEILERSQALVAVASKSPLPASVPAVRLDLINAAAGLSVNGLYRLNEHGGARYFERVVPDGLADEYPELIDSLPARVDAGSYGRIDDEDDRVRLLEAGVLLDVPPGY